MQDPTDLLDQRLPVLSARDIDIAAPADLVCELLTDIGNWPGIRTWLPLGCG
ncbi:hypothetical protein [Kribbella pittospori]|uniref:hypothetical protein n=1 Tax=Kribbella pittospori TaxID=722689 RepID=UPI0013F4613C|nr:hypothetical protein [Kribbella pittospori]